MYLRFFVCFIGDTIAQAVFGWCPHVAWNLSEKVFTSCFEENCTNIKGKRLHCSIILT